jgi:fucose permease
MWRGQPATALTVLNFFFSIGATLAPPLMGVVIERGAAVWIPVAYAVITLLGAAIASRLRVADYQASDGMPVSVEERHAPGDAASGNASNQDSPRLWPFVAASMAVLFLYVGVETSLGGWATTHLLRATEASAFLAASAPSFYWLALLLSRVVAVALLSRVGMLAVLLTGAALATVGSLLLPGIGVATWALAALALAGFGLGPIFPTAVGYFLRYSGERGAAIMGYLFAAGSIGGGLIPFAVGQVAETGGNLGVALLILPVVSAMMLVAMLVAAKTRPR